MLDPKISLYSECKDNLDVWSKKFCFKTVHTGVNKLSNNTSTKFYDLLWMALENLMQVSFHMQR